MGEILEKINMILTNGYEPDIRVQKEAEYLSKRFQVDILAWNKLNNGYPKLDLVNKNFKVHRFNRHTNPGSGLKQVKQYILYIKDLRKHIFINKPNYLHCHDFDGLLAGNLATFFRRKKFHFVYDSHEFELGRSTLTKRNKIFNLLIKYIEKRLLKNVSHNIFVSESQKKLMSKIYKLKTPMTILRNIPPKWELVESSIEQKKAIMLQKFKKFKPQRLVMYHGIINSNRGIEIILSALVNTNNIGLVLLGKGPEEYFHKIISISRNLNIEQKIIFMPFTFYDELWKYVGAVDLGLIVLPSFNQSEIVSLPNKLFENIQSMTPVLVSNFPEMSSIVNEMKIGESVDPMNGNEISKKIQDLVFNEKKIENFKKNLRIAKDVLKWENEVLQLLDVYRF